MKTRFQSSLKFVESQHMSFLYLPIIWMHMMKNYVSKSVFIKTEIDSPDCPLHFCESICTCVCFVIHDKDLSISYC